MGMYTSHTRGLAGFWGPGGSVVEGRWSLGSRGGGEEGPPFGDVCSIDVWLSDVGRKEEDESLRIWSLRSLRTVIATNAK